MVRYIILAAVIILGVAGVILMNAEADEIVETGAPLDDAGVYNAPPQTEYTVTLAPVAFSHTETFYDTNIDVVLSSEHADAVIFFTVDGSPPSRYSRVYNMPIRIPAGNRVRATTIKAIAIYFEDEHCDGFASPVVTNSYLVGRDVFERFTADTFVFVLSADPFDLFDYYHGIAIEGFLRDDYIENERGGRRGGIDPPAPANFNIRGRESERDFYVEVYDFEGNTLIHQAAGGRVQGGWSRASSQKSWRLIARSEYGEGKFRHAFFDNTFNYHGQHMTRFDRLILRNGANDREHANIRDELAGSLARQAGFPDVQAFAPSAVFLNSEYYGFAWLKESMCYGYLVQKYGGLKDNYEIVERTERGVSDRGTPNSERAMEDWLYVIGLADAALDNPDRYGFTDDAVFEEFCSLVDIDNFMLYYAIQTYIDNRDWPNNNMRMWRYYADADEVITCSFNDGRWRFLMYDIEFSLGIYGQGNNANTLSHVLGRRGSGAHMGGHSVLLQAVLQREDMREMYANTINDLIYGAFSTDNIIATLDAIASRGDPELLQAVQERTIWLWDLGGNRDQIRQFAQRRPQVFPMHMLNVFELPDDTPMFSAVLSGAEGADAWLNTRRVTQSCPPVTTSYYSIYSVPLKVQPYAGYGFVSWEINGVHYYEPDMRITADMADAVGNVRIALHTERAADSAPLFINELCTASGADWITLYNPNETAVSTRTYYLSDDINNLRKWKIPSILINPGETITIVMSNNSSPDIIMKPQTNFSLSVGETLFLWDETDGIIGMVEIPQVEAGERIVRGSDGIYTITAH
jgi:hypothetical protein